MSRALQAVPGAPLLAAQGLGVQVPGARGEAPRWLLRGLTLAVQPGQCWALLGRNGAGKTQLLHTLAGARAPAVGTLAVAGQPLAAWPLGALACWRGYVPQQVVDAFPAPVLDVVLQGRHPHLSRWHWEGETDEALARAALARVGLAGWEARDVTTLSGGERQRVALATLLTQDPPLALLDEPLAHLDLAQQLRMLDLLGEDVRSGRRALIVSIHDLSLAQRVATHALLLDGQGGPALAGPVAEVMREDTLSAAFDHPLRRREMDGHIWWLPA
ncbi:ABC transporter ATP-binding protein [Ideonella sp. B7]|uniref:ABC transporter ATP-binding protein n=1 Tax=Ideonella benzenivorans TaxID=2831643 RepID=UPI001CEDDBCA|nr:ABC transporter ATP-binding protein [Ideonella benzenivorans]MCA6215675.1 ABC transporter ATP-binding protein [Ideonella benzenivorans]